MILHDYFQEYTLFLLKEIRLLLQRSLGVLGFQSPRILWLWSACTSTSLPEALSKWQKEAFLIGRTLFWKHRRSWADDCSSELAGWCLVSDFRLLESFGRLSRDEEAGFSSFGHPCAWDAPRARHRWGGAQRWAQLSAWGTWQYRRGSHLSSLALASQVSPYLYALYPYLFISLLSVVSQQRA